MYLMIEEPVAIVMMTILIVFSVLWREGDETKKAYVLIAFYYAGYMGMVLVHKIFPRFDFLGNIYAQVLSFIILLAYYVYVTYRVKEYYHLKKQ